MKDGISGRHFEDGTNELLEVERETAVVTKVIHGARGALTEGGVGLIEPGLDASLVEPGAGMRVARDQAMVLLQKMTCRREE